jgi:hypothetical protein
MSYVPTSARDHAFELIKTAIASNAIKLIGNAGSTDDSEMFAAADAKYLLKLFTDLTAGLQK